MFHATTRKRLKTFAWLVTYLMALAYLDTVLVGCSSGRRTSSTTTSSDDTNSSDTSDLGLDDTATTTTTTTTTDLTDSDLFDTPLDTGAMATPNPDLIGTQTTSTTTDLCLTNDDFFGGFNLGGTTTRSSRADLDNDGFDDTTGQALATTTSASTSSCFAPGSELTDAQILGVGNRYLQTVAACAEKIMNRAYNPRSSNADAEYTAITQAAIRCFQYALESEDRATQLTPELERPYNFAQTNISAFAVFLLDPSAFQQAGGPWSAFSGQ